MAGFSPGVVEKSSETVVEQPPLARSRTRISRQALLVSRRHAKEVQRVTDAVQGVGMLPGGLRLRQFRRGVLPAFTRPRGRMVKKLMRPRTCSILGVPQAVRDNGLGLESLNLR